MLCIATLMGEGHPEDPDVGEIVPPPRKGVVTSAHNL